MAGCNKVAKCNDRPLDRRSGFSFGANNTSAVHARVRVVRLRIGRGLLETLEANGRACRKEILVNVNSRRCCNPTLPTPVVPLPCLSSFYCARALREFSEADSPFADNGNNAPSRFVGTTCEDGEVKMTKTREE